LPPEELQAMLRRDMSRILKKSVSYLLSYLLRILIKF
jgi:hypothetical protein